MKRSLCDRSGLFETPALINMVKWGSKLDTKIHLSGVKTLT